MSQQAAVGKALWHQFMRVVILRQNMRQIGQTEDDRKYWQALENMRYCACTPADVTFLQTLVSSQAPGRRSAGKSPFRNGTIITAENLHKDEINQLGTTRFARDTNQEL